MEHSSGLVEHGEHGAGALDGAGADEVIADMRPLFGRLMNVSITSRPWTCSWIGASARIISRRTGCCGPAPRSPRQAARSGHAPTTTACRPAGRRRVPAVEQDQARTPRHASAASSSRLPCPPGASQHAAVVAAPAGRRVQGIPVQDEVLLLQVRRNGSVARSGRGEHLDPVDDFQPRVGTSPSTDGRHGISGDRRSTARRGMSRFDAVRVIDPASGRRHGRRSTGRSTTPRDRVLGTRR